MTCEYVFRDVTDIYSRLFNHRAAVHGLASNFVKEFEERRGESDYISMTRTLELVTDCRDRAYPETMEGLQDSLEQLVKSVKTTSQMTHRILKDSENKKVDWLESERARRKREWEEFMAAQEARKERVDADFNNTVRHLESHYTDLEVKLKSGTKKTL